MNMLTGYISSTSGQALINGIDILEDPIKAKAQIGYLPELPPLYLDMTVMGYLNFVYDLKKCKLPRRSHLKDVCNLCRISDVSGRVIKHLSKGYRQRVGLAQALISNPPILILDEPTVGLDPKQIIEIRTLVKKLGKKHTVILSSHILSEVQEVCDRVVIINHGQIAANDTIDNLSKAVSGVNRLVVRISGPKNEVLQAIRAIDDVTKVRADMERERRSSNSRSRQNPMRHSSGSEPDGQGTRLGHLQNGSGRDDAGRCIPEDHHGRGCQAFFGKEQCSRRRKVRSSGS